MLPKFDIGIDSPDGFMADDNKLRLVVRANYTHGKPMKGTVVVEVERLFHLYSDGRRDTVPAKKTVPINGQEKVEFDVKKELKFDDRRYFKSYYVKAEVTENLTGLSRSCEMTIDVEKSYVIRTNPENNVKFKQGSTAGLTVCYFINLIVQFC